MIYKPPIGQSDWSEVTSHGTKYIIIIIFIIIIIVTLMMEMTIVALLSYTIYLMNNQTD